MDIAILHLLNETLASPVLDVLMVGLTFGGFALLPGIGVVLWVAGHKRTGSAILTGLLSGWALTMLFQFLALRPRPAMVRLVIATPNYPSYPSGHAAAALSTAVILVLAFRRPVWQVLALLGAGLIAISRVYLGLHFPSDVLGGAVLGAGVGAACYGLIVSGHRGRSALAWLVWLQAAIVLVGTQMAYLGYLPLFLLRWPMADKALHALLFGAVAFWLDLWLNRRSIQVGRIALPLAILIPFGLAAIEEGLQSLSPLRTAGLDDLASDLSGMCLFLWSSRRIARTNSSLIYDECPVDKPA